MDKRSIFSKTGKGSLEISKKTIKLAADERQTLILIDGKSSYGELEEKLSRIEPARLAIVINRLVELELVREFVSKQGPDSLMPSIGGPTGMKVEEISESDLDFTALAPVAAPDDVSREIKERRATAERAEADAREAREREAREAEARRGAEEEARRRAEEETRVRAELEARRRAEEEQRRAAEEEARRRADEEARVRAEEEARRRAEEDARRRAEEEARRKAEEEARRRAEEEARIRAEEEARRRAEEEARRRAEEEARRRAEEEARQRAEEEARRRAEEEARRRAEEEARRRAEEEQRAREEAARREREEAEQREREETERRRREEAERRDREEAERRDRVRREEEQRQAAYEEERRQREAAEAAQREEYERRERARREEEAKRAAIAEEKRAREESETRARDDSLRVELERAETQGQGAFAAMPLDGAGADSDAERRAAEEAARYTAALTPHLEQASAQSLDLDFNDAAHGASGEGPSSILDPGLGASSILDVGDGQESAGSDKSRKEMEKESRRELEREAKENAKAAAKAKKEAEREAKRQAQAGKIRVRRGGGSGITMGKIIGIFIVLLIAGGIGYLYFMPIDKRLIESQATARFGAQVSVGTASFQPFPPQLIMSNVKIDDIVLPRVVGVPDPGSLAADKKIWNSIDVTGAKLTLAQAKKLIEIGSVEAPKGVSMTVQRVRLVGMTVTDAPVALPVMDVTALLAADGTVRQANFTFADNKGQLQLAIDEKGWLVDFESRGYTWGLGPKTAWESLRAKGVATARGIKFDSIAIAQFGGNINGAGELAWGGPWKFSGNMEVGGMDVAAISQAYYNAAPVSGNMDGKFKVEMSAPALTGLVESTQLDGSVVVNKATVSSIDLARSAPANAVVVGVTRFSDFASDLATAGPKVMIKKVRATAGLLSVQGDVNVEADKTLSGTLNIELGIASNLTKANLKVSGTPAEPKLSKKE